MLRAILNKSWRQHPTRHQLYGHLPPITKTIQVRRTRHAGHCWRSRDELISDLLLWTPTHGRAKAGRPARIYIQQLCEDTGCCPEDLPEAMNDREEWREKVRDISATSTTWWWWWWWYVWTFYEHMYISYIYVSWLWNTGSEQLIGISNYPNWAWVKHQFDYFRFMEIILKISPIANIAKLLTQPRTCKCLFFLFYFVLFCFVCFYSSKNLLSQLGL